LITGGIVTLDELCERWKEYVWIFHARHRYPASVKRERHIVPLATHYYKCEKTLVGRKKIPALKLYRKQPDDGSSAGHEWDLVRCDAKGNCYLSTFLTRNITKYRWKKCGIFVSAEVI